MHSAEVIGSGKYGTVYKVCMNKACNKKVARKNSQSNLGFEYKIMKLLFDLVPSGIVKPIDYKKVGTKDTLYLEFININNKNKIYSLSKVKKILKEVVTTLIKIQSKYPSFRHNDLHWENIFNSKDNTKILIGDFGFSNIQMNGYKNPQVQRGDYIQSYGIDPKQNKKYDIAFLLNDINLRGNQEIKNFIGKLIPKEYLEMENNKVINGRMRYNADHSKFPSLKKILYKL